jgi:Predicted hydrolase of the alpha/beta-hydrolase fold
MAAIHELQFPVPDAGDVSAIFHRPDQARWLLLFAHGAGAGIRHPFMENLSVELAAVRMATLRYQFPYLEQRRGRPDSPAVLTATVAAALRTANESAPGLPVLAGGKSMGGRMTSQAAAQGLLPDVRGLVFFGFPLHPPNNPGTKRADHLAKVRMPMLFLQGTRDTLADLTLLRPIIKKLGDLATLHIMESADHGFHVLKRSGKTDGSALTELAQITAAWAARLSQ